MIVLCTGMFRGGSTWSFNVCKNIMQMDNHTLFSEYNESLEDVFKENATKYDNILLKCHKVDDFGKTLIKQNCVKTVYTYREPMDAIVSGMQVFNHSFDAALAAIKSSLEFMIYQKKYGALLIYYNEVVNNSINTIRRISNYLGYYLKHEDVLLLDSKLSKESLKKFSDQITNSDKNIIDVGFSFYDKDTLLHVKHIRDENSAGWKEFLTEEQKKTVIASLRPFLNESGLLNLL